MLVGARPHEGGGRDCHAALIWTPVGSFRQQVQRLRSSELQSRNSTSPSASPRGTSSSSPRGPPGKGGYLGEGPPLKVAKYSPGSSLRVDVENGIPPLGKGASPSPKPGSPAPVAGMIFVLTSRCVMTSERPIMRPRWRRWNGTHALFADVRLDPVHQSHSTPRTPPQIHQVRWRARGRGGRLQPAGASRCLLCVIPPRTHNCKRFHDATRCSLMGQISSKTQQQLSLARTESSCLDGSRSPTPISQRQLHECRSRQRERERACLEGCSWKRACLEGRRRPVCARSQFCTCHRWTTSSQNAQRGAQ